MKLKFRAVSDVPIVEMDSKSIPHSDGVIVGQLVGDRLCGEIISKDGHKTFKWTCSIFESTLEPVFELNFKEKTKYVISILFGSTWIR